MPQLKAVLFDLDDTLIDWSGFDGDYQSMERVRFESLRNHFATSGHELPPVEYLLEAFRTRTTAQWESGRETMIAPHLPRIITSILRDFDTPEHLLDEASIVRHYGWQKANGTRVFPEVPTVLQSLLDAGLTLGIVTNAFQTMVMRDVELEQHGLLHFFKTCRFAAADVGYLKPHPIIFEVALECIGTQPEETVFVGDNLNADVAGAQRLGMRTVWRDTGHHTSRISRELIHPDATVTALDEMFPFFDNWYPQWRE